VADNGVVTKGRPVVGVLPAGGDGKSVAVCGLDAVALDAMHATPEERMGFEGMSRGSGVCGRCHCKPSPPGCSW
jgi:hypothetical protein